jgi:3-hydroxyacyl-CoA dehydrogenase
MQIRSVSVLGAGTMGSQIAAHLANAGVPVLLLDVTRDVARTGFEKCRTLKPDPFFTPGTQSLVRTGGFDEDLPTISGSDWVIEAIIERLDIKRALLARVEQHRAPHAIVSSNTSGIPIASLAEGRSREFRAAWLGTHFFNPPRYLHLLELIPTADTDPAIAETVRMFADHRLGKGVVIAKDTPNFIANHLGLHGVVLAFRALASGEYTVEEIDAMTGPAIGRAKSATFRTVDIAGIDVLAHVARNLAERLESEESRQKFTLPPLVETLIERGMIGVKSGQGFYKREASGEILTLDPSTLTFRAAQPAKFPSIDAARSIDDVGARLRTLFSGNDKVGRFLRATLAPSLMYAAEVTPSIARCAGGSRGNSVPSKHSTRSASTASSTPAPPHRFRRFSKRHGRRAASDRPHLHGRRASRQPPRICRSFAPPANAAASFARTPERALSILETACSASSSTRR